MPVKFYDVRLDLYEFKVKTYEMYSGNKLCNCCGSYLGKYDDFPNYGITVSPETPELYVKETDEYWVEEVKLDNGNTLFIKHNSYIPEKEDEDDEW